MCSEPRVANGEVNLNSWREWNKGPLSPTTSSVGAAGLKFSPKLYYKQISTIQQNSRNFSVPTLKFGLVCHTSRYLDWGRFIFHFKVVILFL